jgi:hypothetical protein
MRARMKRHFGPLKGEFRQIGTHLPLRNRCKARL